MGCGDEKLSKYLTQTFTAHCNAMICQQVTLSGDAEWPKVADAVIEANTYPDHGCLCSSATDLRELVESGESRTLNKLAHINRQNEPSCPEF